MLKQGKWLIYNIYWWMRKDMIKSSAQFPINNCCYNIATETMHITLCGYHISEEDRLTHKQRVWRYKCLKQGKCLIYNIYWWMRKDMIKSSVQFPSKNCCYNQGAESYNMRIEIIHITFWYYMNWNLFSATMTTVLCYYDLINMTWPTYNI